MPARHPPGPSTLRVIASARRFFAHPLATIEGWVAEHGGVLRIPLGRGVVVVSEPAAMREVLDTRRARFDKASSWNEVRALVGGGLAAAPQARWADESRRVAALYAVARADDAQLAAAVGELVATWERALGGARQVRRDVRGDLRAVAGRLATAALLGAPSDAIAEAEEAAATALVARLRAFPKTPLDRPTAVNVALHRGIARLDAALATARCDVARDDAVTFLWKAIDPCAAALAWTLLELARDVEAQARARRDAAFLGRAVAESLRLHPVVPFLVRDARADTEVGGFLVAAGSIVVVSPLFAHLDVRWWREPRAFRPDRFLDPPVDDAYLPFGLPPRTCPGEALATRWISAVLAGALRSFEVAVDPTIAVVPEPLVTLAPKGEVPLILRRI